ncbi:MAG: hypothetical protein CUN56_10485 [Phototrophicales bacterium]|nr:MAG: hypothetical protein CUN56_10485 [Phototrophicales bacterium]RMG74505.1 MAG: hypothetical protein D6711_08680 [Chloroflexota bacterium]
MSNYNRYSHHARRALSHARMLTVQYHHPRIDTGHLLVGVMLTRGSIGHSVLFDLQLDAEQAQLHLKNLVLPVPDSAPPPNDAALDSALNLAADEAAWLGHHYIGTEHLLLGITRTNVGNAVDLFHKLGVSPDTVRHHVRRALDYGLTEFNLQFARKSARLSELSRRVINAAEQNAVALDHPSVGIIHLLQVLLNEKRSIVAELLTNHGLTFEKIQSFLDQPDDNALQSIEGVMLKAGDLARHYGNHYTGTEHLLLALIQDANGKDLLHSLNINAEKLKQDVALQLKKRQ